MRARQIAVVDIGKTNAKVLLIDLETGQELFVRKSPNEVIATEPYPHFSEERLWSFILDGLSELSTSHRVDAITITAHGASAALVSEDGSLSLPLLDYEHGGPDQLATAYDRLRPPFSETGSPRLPIGFNVGAQLYWQSQAFADAFAKTQYIMTYPQFWAFRLTGVPSVEYTSLGCHTDLWNPWQGRFSSLIDRLPKVNGRSWRSLLPPLRHASDVLGPLLPELARRTGLPPGLPVYCGIHDSNASLLPYLGGRESSFAVMSTGTWMISFAVGGKSVALDPGRDTLVNVNARGEPTPTARFMGGREFEELTGGDTRSPGENDTQAVLAAQQMALPSLHPAIGPFPGLVMDWLNGEAAPGPARIGAASFYCALVGATCLELIGAQGPTHVEGPFAGNRAFLGMLAAATGRPVIASQQSAGTGLGAALLAGPATSLLAAGEIFEPPSDPAFGAYVEAWRSTVAERWKARPQPR